MARQSRTWAPTFLQDLKDWLKQLVEDQWHQERVGEQIDLVNPAMAKIQGLRAAEKSKRS
jgi:hypothetical protein